MAQGNDVLGFSVVVYAAGTETCDVPGQVPGGLEIGDIGNIFGDVVIFACINRSRESACGEEEEEGDEFEEWIHLCCWFCVVFVCVCV